MKRAFLWLNGMKNDIQLKKKKNTYRWKKNT